MKLTLTFLLLSILFLSCNSSNKLKISNPEEFLVKSGYWCSDGNIHNCIRFTGDSVFYIKDFTVYMKTPFQVISYDTILRELNFSDYNVTETERLKILIKDMYDEKISYSELDGIILFRKIYFINNDIIGIQDIDFKNGKMDIEKPIYSFSKLSSLTGKERSK